MRARIQVVISGSSDDTGTANKIAIRLLQPKSIWSVEGGDAWAYSMAARLRKEIAGDLSASASTEHLEPGSAEIKDLITKFINGSPASDPKIEEIRQIMRQESLRHSTRMLVEHCLSALMPKGALRAEGEQCALLFNSQYGVYGLLAWGKNAIRVDLDHDESVVLKAASQNLVEALTIIMEDGPLVQAPRTVEGSFSEVEIYAGEKRVLLGTVKYYASRLQLARSVVLSGPASIYYGIGVSLLAASAVSFFGFGLEAAARWFDDLMGALATSFFGAALVESAIEYNKVRGDRSPEKLKTGVAMVRWESTLMGQVH